MSHDDATRLLGLQGFLVAEIKIEGQEVELRIDYDTGGELICAQCGESTLAGHDEHELRVRDLPVFGRLTHLRLRRRRLQCPRCRKVCGEYLPHLADHARMTARLARTLHAECADAPVEAVSRRHGLAWSTVCDADRRALESRIAACRLDGLRRIAVDEISHSKGHHYLTVVTDLDRRRVARTYENRQEKSLLAFFDELGPSGCERIEVVVTDMWRPYRKAIRRRLPRAALVIDKFHVIRLVQAALDTTRRAEQARLPPAEAKALKGSRWLLLRTPAGVKERGKWESLMDLLALNETLAKAYLLKEEFRQWYRLTPAPEESPSAFFARVRDDLRKWYRHVRESGLQPFVKAVETVKRWRGAIVNYFHTRVTNGLSEALNNVIRVLQRRAYGYRNKAYLIMKIYQKAGLI